MSKLIFIQLSLKFVWTLSDRGRLEPRACLTCVKLSQNLPVLHNSLADIERACGHWFTATTIVYCAATCGSFGVENKILITVKGQWGGFAACIGIAHRGHLSLLGNSAVRKESDAYSQKNIST